MKKWKKLLLLLLCLTLVQVPVQLAASPVTVQAATKNGLTYNKTKGKYYYYKDGKIVKNTWKTVNGYRYYFGKDGAAYAAGRLYGISKNIVVKKIGTKYYGFNNRGRMVKGIFSSVDGKFYIFNSDGVYNATKSKTYRAAAKEGRSAATLRKLLGKPLETYKSDSCVKPNCTDVALYYKNVVVVLLKNNSTGKETVYCVSPK